MAGDKPNPTQRPAPARGPGGGALQQRKRPAISRVEINVLNRRVDLHAIDATPARWRGDVGSTQARTASGGRRPQQQPGILRFYAEETPGLKIGPTTVTRPRRIAIYSPSHAPQTTHAQVLVMSVMFVGFVVLLHIYGKLTAVPDAVDEDPIMPETPGADA